MMVYGSRYIAPVAAPVVAVDASVVGCGFGNKSTLIPSDIPRLQTQLDTVREIVADGQWRTIDTIAALVESKTGHRATPQSVSARLRDLRKPHFGGYRVDRRRVSGSNGLFEYRVSCPTI